MYIYILKISSKLERIKTICLTIKYIEAQKNFLLVRIKFKIKNTPILKYLNVNAKNISYIYLNLYMRISRFLLKQLPI